MHSTRATLSPPHSQRRRAAMRGVVLLGLVLLALVAVGVYAAWRRIEARTLAGQVRHGLDLLAPADNPGTVREALDRWERDVRPAGGWSDDLIEHLFTKYPLSDVRVRLMLTRAGGADFGDRVADWRRWFADRKRLRAGKAPRPPTAEVVRLTHAWTAPVGLTAWFTTILPLRGSIYVASLGQRFDDPNDPADGVVRVNGSDGTAQLLFMPPPRTGRGPRDVIGIAAGRGGLFAACWNGMVYWLDPDGDVRWETHVGAPVTGAPLSCDLNDDGVDDVLVATRAGSVVALSGQGGRTIWSATVSRTAKGEGLLGTTLALGDVLPGQGREVVVATPLGDLDVLSARTGRSRWRQAMAAGSLAGAIAAGERVPAPPVYVADRAARVWSLLRSGDQLRTALWGWPGLRGDETIIAGLRLLRVTPDAAPFVVACPTGDYLSAQGAVVTLAADGVHWRHGIGGAIWATPAVGDLTGDGTPEIAVASIEPTGEGRVVGVLTILSPSGHCLQRVVFDAPIECPPVIADVDGDNRLELLVADQGGYLHCFKTHRVGPVTWGLPAGDTHNTRNADNAFSCGQAPFHLQWDWRPE